MPASPSARRADSAARAPDIRMLIDNVYRTIGRRLSRLERAGPGRPTNFAKFLADKTRTAEALTRVLKRLLKPDRKDEGQRPQ